MVMRIISVPGGLLSAGKAGSLGRRCAKCFSAKHTEKLQTSSAISASSAVNIDFGINFLRAEMENQSKSRRV
jgi:hypothetical protein